MSDDTGTDDVTSGDAMWDDLLRRSLHDPVPADVIARSLALWDLTTIDAELADLLAEEAADAELAGVRSATLQITAFTFVAGDVTIEVEWDGELLSGQLFPGEPATVELHGERGVQVDSAANSVGTFELELPGPGSWCLVVRRTTGAVRTPWFTIS